MLLSAVCLSRTSGLTREQRGLGRPKLAEVAHVTRDLDTTFKVKRSRSPGRFTQRGLNAYGGCSGSPWERVCRGKLLIRCVCSARPRDAHTLGGEGQRHIVSPCAQLVRNRTCKLLYFHNRISKTSLLN